MWFARFGNRHQTDLSERRRECPVRSGIGRCDWFE
jgi:hypothetical protein